MVIWALVAILAGFALMIWSADRFVEGAADTAKHLGVPSLLIGMVIVGFGTSAPEMLVSAMAASDGNPGLALGNGLGSNIVNISLIIGVTALVVPLKVHSRIVKREIPLLLLIGFLLGYFLLDHTLTRNESLILLGGFFALIIGTILTGLKAKDDPLKTELERELEQHTSTLGNAVFRMVGGFLLLLLSSRMLVWGAVELATMLGVSDLIIGLTIVALGTSLPELAASVSAARKGEFDIAVGNVIGSNMFNLLAVVGIAGVIQPLNDLGPEVLNRDWMVMMGLNLAMLIMAYTPRKGEGTINRVEGAILLAIYVGYNAVLISSQLN